MKFFLSLALLSVTSITLCYSGYSIYNRLYKACTKYTSKEYVKERELYSKYLQEKYNAQKLSIKSEDGIELAGLLIKRPNAKRVITLFHGYRQSKEHIYSWVDLFKDDTIFLIDFRAHGDSQGNIVSLGYHESKDVKAAINFLKNHEETRNLNLYAIGISMGSVALLKAISEGVDFKAIVLDSGFACLETQIEYNLLHKVKLPSFLLSLAKYLFQWNLPNCFDKVRNYSLIKNIKTPVFVIHSSSDKTVPVESAELLFNNAKSPKELWIESGSKHIHMHQDFKGEYIKRVNNFFDRYK